MYDVIIVGGGASGFFTAHVLTELLPDNKVLILEKTDKILQKVKISGGGRCNVTHAEFNQTSFSKSYPRGEKILKKNLRSFGAEEMISWLANKGVKTKTEADGRMFPESNTSETIVNTLKSVLNHKTCALKKKTTFLDFTRDEEHYAVKTNDGELKCKHLVFSAGSSKQLWKLLENKGLKTVPSVPSLFTFSFRNHTLKGLEGISVEKAFVKIVGHKLQHSGPLLITHKGVSGPSVLKLSAYGARILNELNYDFSLLINFTGLEKEQEVRTEINNLSTSKKLISNATLFGLSKRLWERLIHKAGIPEDKSCNELSKKEKNKLFEELYQGEYKVSGKNTFKEEFVTAGGIDLSEINKQTYEMNKLPNVYATGEFLNIDGVTGGFNFQACWTSGYLVANSICAKKIDDLT